MRDQSVSSYSSIAIDLAYIDEHEQLDPERFKQIINNIWDPAVQIIEPTFATGQNTRLFISLCKKLIVLAKLGFNNAMGEIEEVGSSVKNVKTVFDSLCKTNKEGGPDAMEADILAQLIHLEHSKLKVFGNFSSQMKDYEQEISTLVRLGEGLLADQKDKGKDIKVGRSLIRYTFQCSIINKQWAVIKKLFAVMANTLSKIELIVRMQKLETVEITDPETGRRLASETTFEALSQKIAEMAEAISRAEEEDDNLGEQE